MRIERLKSHELRALIGKQSRRIRALHRQRESARNVAVRLDGENRAAVALLIATRKVLATSRDYCPLTHLADVNDLQQVIDIYLASVDATDSRDVLEVVRAA